MKANVVHITAIVAAILLFVALTVGPSPTMAQTNDEAVPETIIESDSYPTESKIEIFHGYLDAIEFNSHYVELMKKTELGRIGREVAITVLELVNKLDVKISTGFDEIGVYTRSKRLFPIIYMFHEGGDGKTPTYQLIDYETGFEVHPGQRIRVNLVFCIRPGDDLFIKNASVFARFAHAAVDRLPLSVSIAQRLDETPEIEEKTPQNAENSDTTEGVDTGNSNVGIPKIQITVPPDFLVADQVTPNSIFRIKYPAISFISEDEGLAEFLGNRGRDAKDLPFLGSALAVRDGDYDYTSAMAYLSEFDDYYQSSSKVERGVIWLPKYRILFSSFRGISLFGVELQRPIELPNDASSVIFFVGNQARRLAIDKTHLAPINYKGRDDGFLIETLGIFIDAAKQGNVYQLQLFHKGSNGAREPEPFAILSYVYPV